MSFNMDKCEITGLQFIYSGHLVVKAETMGDRWVVKWIKTEDDWNREEAEFLSQYLDIRENRHESR